MPKSWMLGAALAVSIGIPFAAAADVTIPSEYDKLIQQRSAVSAFGDDLFGERIDLSMGGLQIVETDIDLPGNNALPVRMGRRFRASQSEGPILGHFGDWDLDIPHLHGEFYDSPIDDAWIVETMSSPDRAKRCSHFGAPPPILRAGGDWAPDEYWHGTSFYLPGGGEQELLKAHAPAHVPGGDTTTYPAVTKDGAAVRCLTSLDPTSDPDSSGEAFEVLTPDGTVYRLDHMVRRTIDRLAKSDSAPMGLAASMATSGMAIADGGTQPRAPVGYSLPRAEVFLYPTLVTDRFGNTVTYTWDSNNPWRLLQIAASDGRQLTFTYQVSPADSYQVATVSDGTRTWTYTATGMTQPDGKSWTWDLSALRTARAHPAGVFCDEITFPDTTGTATGTITTPSGAGVTYTMTATLFGRSHMLRECYGPDVSNLIAVDPYLFEGMAVTSRKLTGLGLPSAGLTWTYAYGPPNNCWAGYSDPPYAIGCTSTSPTTRTTTVTDPGGNISRDTFGNVFNDNEGLLVRSEAGVSGSTALRTATYAYAAADDDDTPYNAYNGASLRHRGDYDITGRYHPQMEVATTQQDKVFTWKVASDCSGMPNCFDSHARPTRVIRKSAPASAPATTDYSRTEATTYHDETTHWVLGQVASVTCAASTIPGMAAEQECGGETMLSTTFDATYALPLTQSSFGKLQQTFGYDTTSAVASGQRGTLETVKDGNNHTTTYTSWKRGIPQSVAFADSTTRSAAVNDSGWITAVTDENGYATNYGYDAMGRLASIAWPIGDSTVWAGTTRSFVRVTSAEYGIPDGHWRETVTTGDAVRITYYDGLWRPLLLREYDAGDLAGTQRFTRTAYDAAGHVAFVSYPSVSSSPAAGVWTQYDALGRVTSVAQDTELSPSLQVATTTYNADFTTTVTDPRDASTTTGYMAYDQPATDWPVSIEAPEDEATTIVRDPFGKPLSITRGETP